MEHPVPAKALGFIQCRVGCAKQVSCIIRFKVGRVHNADADRDFAKRAGIVTDRKRLDSAANSFRRPGRYGKRALLEKDDELFAAVTSREVNLSNPGLMCFATVRKHSSPR